MKRLIVLFVCGWMLMAGCSSDNKIPADVLPPDKMKVMVWEMMLADQLVLQEPDRYRGKNAELYGQIFSIHGTDKKSFYQSMAFYEGRPDLLKALMDSVNNFGAEKRNDLYRSKPAEPNKEH